MKKKRVSFAPVLRPRSPTPRLSASSLTPVSLSSCPPQAPTSGHQPVPPLPASPPDQTNIPSLIIGPAPLLPARKASSLHRSSCLPHTPCPVNPHSSASLPLAQVVSHTTSQCPFLPNPPSRPFLASGPVDRGFTGLSPPPARSPLPTTSPALDHPANCTRGHKSQPQGTAQRFRCQTPAIRREQNTVESGHR